MSKYHFNEIEAKWQTPRELCQKLMPPNLWSFVKEHIHRSSTALKKDDIATASAQHARSPPT